jgi:hypothetical protein
MVCSIVKEPPDTGRSVRHASGSYGSYDDTILHLYIY